MTAAISTPTTCDIDFLPTSYRQAGIQRKNTTLRVGVSLTFIAVIVFAAFYQQRLRLLAEQQLTGLMPQYDRAKQQMQHMAELQQLLQTEEKRAELCTYLRHPWPRSQILAALAEPLPEEIELREVSIVREPLPLAEHPASAPTTKIGETALAKLHPCERDLLVLRDQWDHTQIVVKCSGVADDTETLHRYLEQLGHDSLLTKVDEGSIERLPGDANDRIRFTVRIVVRPGYGQPNGPQPATETVTATTPQTGQ
jgi:Tfp pilus assembly protein PilN